MIGVLAAEEVLAVKHGNLYPICIFACINFQLQQIMDHNEFLMPLMYDVAHNIINDMFANAIKEHKPEEEIAMYREELKALHSPNPHIKRSMFEKAMNYYSPIVKARYAD